MHTEDKTELAKWKRGFSSRTVIVIILMTLSQWGDRGICV